MSARIGTFGLGLFVLAGIAVLIAGVLVIGAGEYGTGGTLMETYLDESVQGLDVGSPVKFRGVEIGRVEEIGFVGNYYPLEPGSPEFYRFGRYVIVRARLSAKWVPTDDPTTFITDLRRLVNEEGLRVMLAAQGLTGTSYLELDYVDPLKNRPADPPWTPRAVYIPGAPSTFSRLGTAAERVFERLEKLQIEQLVQDLDRALVVMTKAVEDAEVADVSQQAVKLLADVRDTSRTLREAIERVDVPKLQLSVEKTLATLEQAVQRLELVVASESGQLDAVMGDLRESTRNLRELSDGARANPSQFLFSAPPAPIVLPEPEESR